MKEIHHVIEKQGSETEEIKAKEEMKEVVENSENTLKDKIETDQEFIKPIEFNDKRSSDWSND